MLRQGEDVDSEHKLLRVLVLVLVQLHVDDRPRLHVEDVKQRGEEEREKLQEEETPYSRCSDPQEFTLASALTTPEVQDGEGTA